MTGRADATWRCGVDEAGRGSLAGPLFAAAVVLDPARPIDGLRDSKSLTPAERERLYDEIIGRALAYGIACATAREIVARGVEWANRIAFTRSVRAMLKRFPYDPGRLIVQIDGNRRAHRLGLRQTLVVRGDQTVAEIAAASILAKVSRDRFVVDHLHPRFPQYGFDRHKGYATRAHRAALLAYGPTSEHRVSWRLMAEEVAAGEDIGEPDGQGR